jgi:hypothetical protein
VPLFDQNPFALLGDETLDQGDVGDEYDADYGCDSDDDDDDSDYVDSEHEDDEEDDEEVEEEEEEEEEDDEDEDQIDCDDDESWLSDSEFEEYHESPSTSEYQYEAGGETLFIEQHALFPDVPVQAPVVEVPAAVNDTPTVVQHDLTTGLVPRRKMESNSTSPLDEHVERPA